MKKDDPRNAELLDKRLILHCTNQFGCGFRAMARLSMVQVTRESKLDSCDGENQEAEHGNEAEEPR